MTFYTFSKSQKKGQKLLKNHIFLLSILLSVIIILCSCHSGGADPLAYQNKALSTDISGRLNDSGSQKSFDFSATLTLGAPPQDSEFREFTIVFHAPKELESVTLSRRPDGSLSFICGNIDCSAVSRSAVENLIKIAEMLDIREDILKISSIPGSSVGFSQYDKLTAVKTNSYTVLIDPHSATPVRIELQSEELTVTAHPVIS